MSYSSLFSWKERLGTERLYDDLHDHGMRENANNTPAWSTSSWLHLLIRTPDQKTRPLLSLILPKKEEKRDMERQYGTDCSFFSQPFRVGRVIRWTKEEKSERERKFRDPGFTHLTVLCVWMWVRSMCVCVSHLSQSLINDLLYPF